MAGKLELEFNLSDGFSVEHSFLQLDDVLWIAGSFDQWTT